ncbi:hypothetical protein F4781DRAFT_168904 [Annulohypoxylon bovei var. microspora]|nr:hypothetical protein F4781DRAFT_168904 [Annulohypoxylon bovei var. microspora]
MEQMISRRVAGSDTLTPVASLILIEGWVFTNHTSMGRGVGVLGVANYTTKGSAYVGLFLLLLLFYFLSCCSFALHSLATPLSGSKMRGYRCYYDTIRRQFTRRVSQSWRASLEEKLAYTFLFCSVVFIVEGRRYIVQGLGCQLEEFLRTQKGRSMLVF